MNALNLRIDYAGTAENGNFMFIARGPGYSEMFECSEEETSDTVVAKLGELYKRYGLTADMGIPMQLTIRRAED